MNRSSYLKLFNNHLGEFIDDILTIFPEDLDLKTCATFLSSMKKINPRMIITGWKDSVSNKYRKEIESGNLSFFENKDYSGDIKDSADEKKILEVIERIRVDLKKCGIENKNKTMKYLQNLTKISDLYFLNR